MARLWTRRRPKVPKPPDEFAKLEEEMRERFELEKEHKFHNPNLPWAIPPTEPCSLCALESLEAEE